MKWRTKRKGGKEKLGPTRISKWILQQLDRVEERREHNSVEFRLRITLREHIRNLAADKEAKWKQWSGCTWLKLEDKNTKYFHALANARKNTNSIRAVQQDGTPVPTSLLPDHLTSHFKEILGKQSTQQHPFDLFGKIGPAFREELRLLDEPFTEIEVTAAVMQMPKGKASGPNGLPAEFYQAFWPIIKDDILDFVRRCTDNQGTIKRINRTSITLIPKKHNPEQVSYYRPNSVINTVVKLITELPANRLRDHLPRLITPNQTTFVQGR